MTFSRLLLPNATKSKTRAQCIGCKQFIYNKYFKRKRQNGTLPLKGKLVSAEKIKKLFACKRILINSKHNYLCTNCDAKDVMELDISTTAIEDQKVQTYNESLSYIQSDYQNYIEKKNNYIKYEKLSNDECVDYSGLTKTQIKTISTEYNLDEQEIFLFYTKCHTYIDNKLLGTLFNKNRNLIGEIFNKTTDNLFDTLAKNELGQNAWTREKINNNTPSFSKQLLNIEENSQLIAVCCDKFSINIEKPGDYNLQKLTYSAKDKVNCIDFHLVTTLNGKYVCIQGGFGATGHNNEQAIMNSLTNKNYIDDSNNNIENIYYKNVEQTYLFRNVIQNDDILILDRGYRRIKKRDYCVKIPHSISKQKNQLTTKQANESRLVTCLYIIIYNFQIYIYIFF